MTDFFGGGGTVPLVENLLYCHFKWGKTVIHWLSFYYMWNIFLFIQTCSLRKQFLFWLFPHPLVSAVGHLLLLCIHACCVGGEKPLWYDSHSQCCWLERPWITNTACYTALLDLAFSVHILSPVSSLKMMFQYGL